MQSLPIVEHLDEIKHLRLGFLLPVILPLMHQLTLEHTEETLGHNIALRLMLATSPARASRRWYATSAYVAP